MLNKLTIVTCSYNTPKVTEVMLKSFIKVHGDGPFNLLVSENSTNNETQDILDSANIVYLKNPGSTHAEGVQKLLDACSTKYALLVDTDIVFKSDVSLLLDVMKKNELTMLGQVCGSRGGFNLHPRVHPWFCLINVENIKKHNIRFTDMNRVKSTNSEAFYKNVPINNARPNNTVLMYDVGATFYEDITKVGLRIANIPNLDKWFIHYEGSSWQRVSGHQGFEILGNSVWQAFQKEIEEHKNIDITNKFVMPSNKRYAFIYPVFIPDSIRLTETITSIKSWLNRINKDEVDIIMGGWCANEELKKEFLVIKDELDPDINVKFFDKNYGKAKVINDLSFNYLASNNNCKYFLTCDSDIVLPTDNIDLCRSIFERMENAAVELETNHYKKFSYFALDQLGECCHIHSKFNNKLIVANEEIVWNTNVEGIAGGALFISVDFWKAVNGYRVMGVYSGDDGYLLYDSNRLGYLASVIKSVVVYHPGNSTKEYSEWKHSQLSKCTGRPVSSLDTAVADADNFWSKK